MAQWTSQLDGRPERDRYEGWAVVEQDVLPALGTPLASATEIAGPFVLLGL